MRRFREHAAIEPIDADWRVTARRRARAHPRRSGVAPAEPRLADAVAAEWQAAGGERGGETSAKLPLTRLAGTAQARIRPDPEPVVLALARYAESDLLCYRAAGPAALAGARRRRGSRGSTGPQGASARALRVTEGVMHVAQDRRRWPPWPHAVAAQPPLALAALGVAVPALGSLVLGLALAEGVLRCGGRRTRLPRSTRHSRKSCGARTLRRSTRRRRIGEEVAVAGAYAGDAARMSARSAWSSPAACTAWGFATGWWRRRRRSGVSGWVRNRRDGTLEVLVDGDEAAVEEFVRACRRGPRLAEVTDDRGGACRARRTARVPPTADRMIAFIQAHAAWVGRRRR